MKPIAVEARADPKDTPGAGQEAAPRHQVEPLVLASSAYVRMERVALAARETLHLAFRIFEPETKLRGDASLELGLSNWGELLEHRANAGVQVRLFLADFDPLFAPDLHATTVASVRSLEAAVARCEGALTVLPSRHPGELGKGWRLALWPLLIRRTAAVGIDRLWPPIHLWPATHHMKTMIADAREMVIGGLDVNERRYDDPTHDRPAEETWHDVSLYVRGPAARDADRFVRWLWDNELRRRAQLKRCVAEQTIMVDEARIARLGGGSVVPSQTPASGGADDVRFHVTASRRRRSLVARGPTLVSASIMEAVIATIASSRWYLYVENQFVRDEAVHTALARQLERVPQLQLIMVVPAAPDEVAFHKNRSNGQRYGEWRQLRILRALQEAFGRRIGIFTLTGAHPPHSLDADRERATEEGRGIVYVHSKVLIADDRLAMVSSANLNGRSLRMDTEAGVSWHDADRVAEFRQRLWAHHLGRTTPSEGDLLTSWRAAAMHNLMGEPGSHGTGRFVVDWNPRKAEAFARRRPYIPARYV